MGMSLREQGSRAARRADSVVRVDAGPELTACAPNPHLHCAPGRPSRRISAITMFRSSSFIFSSTTFSGIKSRAEPERGISWEVLQAGLGARCHPPWLLHPPALQGPGARAQWGRAASCYSHWLLMKQCAASSFREWTSKSTRWKRRLLAVGRLSGLRVRHDRMNS